MWHGYPAGGVGMKLSIEIGADGCPFDESGDPVVVVIDGAWTAAARHTSPAVAAVTVQKSGGDAHTVPAFITAGAWHPGKELDGLAIAKTGKALVWRALLLLPLHVRRYRER